MNAIDVTLKFENCILFDENDKKSAVSKSVKIA